MTATLLLCVLSSALPAEAVFSPYGSMPCCRGMMSAGGECHGNSCPIHRRALSKPPDQAQSEPACADAHGHHAQEESAHASQAPSQHGHTHDHAQAEVEHEHGAGVSPQNTSQPTSRQPSAEAASLGRPCPSDCCGTVTSAFSGLRRQRNETGLSDALRARPPSIQSQQSTFPGISKAASALRRSHPPRPPPTALI